MKRQFLKLFSAILVTLLFVAAVTELVFEQDTSSSPEVNMQAVFAAIDQAPSSFVEHLTIIDLAWPDDLLQKLNAGEVVSLISANNEVTYFKLHQNADNVIKIGPIIAPKNSSNNQ